MRTNIDSTLPRDSQQACCSVDGPFLQKLAGPAIWRTDDQTAYASRIEVRKKFSLAGLDRAFARLKRGISDNLLRVHRWPLTIALKTLCHLLGIVAAAAAVVFVRSFDLFADCAPLTFRITLATARLSFSDWKYTLSVGFGSVKIKRCRDPTY
jgi:hypothetical protein